IAHHEWLADGPGDPRPELARALVAACLGARTVVAYNAQFERRCIEMLADAVPELADDLLDIAERLADPLPIVREHVYHPDFHGSFSLKSVLPALVPTPAPEPPASDVVSVERALRACSSSLDVGAGLAPALKSPVIARSPAKPGDAAISWPSQGPPNPASNPARPPHPASPYDALEIAEGATASVELEHLLFHADTLTAREKQHLRNALLRYCALDTMSMVRLLGRLRDLS
ncbi:MAG: DUF2779 domain-containing protein, partial [Acidobacteriia bacterium]|nr:DUF2779 domain-containing protein [Terriglobia bacterium]